MAISPLAVVETTRVGMDVVIHPFAVVGPDVTLGDRVVIHPHAVLEGVVELGEGVQVLPCAHLGRAPALTAVVARRPGASGPVHIGPNTSIGNHAVVYTDVQIGEDTLIGDGASIREGNRIGNRCLIGRYVTVNYDSSIGDGTKVMDLSVVTGNCRIGNDAFISFSVVTVNDDLLGRMGYDVTRAVGPTIEDGAAVGAGAIILPNTVIGRGATVASGAVVTRDVATEALVMGVPARKVEPRQDD